MIKTRKRFFSKSIALPIVSSFSFRRPHRNQKGASILVLMMLLGLLVLPLLGFLSFEIGRSILAIQQLQHALDSAALAAACSLASQDDSDSTTAHKQAIESALGIFRRNSVLGNRLTSSTSVGSLSGGLSPGQSMLKFEFQDPLTKLVVPFSDARGKLVRVTGRTSLIPAFGKFLGLGQYDLNAQSSGRVPKLDMVMCFDVSGSIDDETSVTCVRRKWDSLNNKISFDVPIGTNGPAQNKLFDILMPAATGSSLNGLEPQNLDEAYFNGGLNFSEYLATNYGVDGLRSLGGYPDQGKPPGNFPPGTAPTFDGFRSFTDVVVNIDGNKTFGGYSYNGYNFPDLATLVEASRGNLENNLVFSQSKANTVLTVAPKSGYQNAYREAAMKKLQPLSSAQDAAAEFIDIMNIDTIAHFGFIAFDAFVGDAPDSKHDWINLDETLPYGDKTGFPLPRVVIESTDGATQYKAVKDSIKVCRPLGATNIGLALHEAVKDMKNGKRDGTIRAIILFTDGQPTTPGGPLDSDPMANARKAALEASAAGIAVHTVGLATNPALVSTQYKILNDENDNPTTGGIAAIAGHGGTFHQVTNSADLRLAFQKVARSLTRIVVNQD
jgi:hypothetical protein